MAEGGIKHGGSYYISSGPNGVSYPLAYPCIGSGKIKEYGSHGLNSSDMPTVYRFDTLLSVPLLCLVSGLFSYNIHNIIYPFLSFNSDVTCFSTV